jgi:predicted dehydrogenase
MTAVLLGAGARGAHAYAPYARKYPHELEFVAVAEADAGRREAFASVYGIAPERAFADWQEVFEQERMADVMIICTQDRMHYGPTVKALGAGYHVLLEKPMSPDPAECLAMERTAKLHGRQLSICHVLRYTPFWSALKRAIREGHIGDLMSIQLNENVGFYHYAHSFVRGHWRNADESSPMILAKSCHDMDILSWLMDRPCLRVSSFGALGYFRPDRAPDGAPLRCTDGCPAEAGCPYSAPRFYLGNSGKEWAAHFTPDLSGEGILKALQEGPYGRCVYRCDNNVVDHQVVNLEFEGGATATFSMCGFTHDVSRSVQVMGTKGEIRGCMEDGTLTIHDFLTRERTEIHTRRSAPGHGGGDEAIVRGFLELLRDGEGRKGASLTSAEASVQSHMMAFAAEESRLAGGQPVEIPAFRSRYSE